MMASRPGTGMTTRGTASPPKNMDTPTMTPIVTLPLVTERTQTKPITATPTQATPIMATPLTALAITGITTPPMSMTWLSPSAPGSICCSR